MLSWTVPSVGQWFVSAEGTRWWFDSGSIALDFAYTGSMGTNPLWERWHAPEDMAQWLEERFGVRFRVTASDLAATKRLRDAVAILVTRAAAGEAFPPATVELLDDHAARPDVAPQLGRDPRPTLDQVLAGLAREAVVVLRDHADRIRECAAGDCQVIYLDTSRSGNRSWCSMMRCGNRNKVRQQRARQKRSTK
ncbi:hypothetical protein EF847_07725 [Actinobacteria bacterium YIM 96077]|uniref:Zinc finger CGNR domain-containing protein n=1 Tax=Phytoactinopolyspora halophila TaxID=1981511 RepID=A0A329QJN9_9ACTN|nr:CGNR zinc finger domain-containing protein [Phytoactinopolyspora halophila]AYY12614.1 hypothetical protein EF847_07725 [Actinobacteria bacterium YIM 96077]RAW12483.1 hypothetical protein DPM12_13865 [Phytoactinopolyspora halophila]